MKKIFLILLLSATTIFPQYHVTDTVKNTSETGKNVQQLIQILERRIATLEQEQLKNTSILETSGGNTSIPGEIIGYNSEGNINQPSSFNIDYPLTFSQRILTIESRLKRAEDSLNAHTTKLYGSGGTITPLAPVYTFNYSPSMDFGLLIRPGYDTTLTRYIKNTGNATLRIIGFRYRTDDVNRSNPYSHVLKNHTSGALQDTIGVGDSLKLLLTYRPYDVNWFDSWQLIVSSTGGVDDTLYLDGTGYLVPSVVAAWRTSGIGGGGWHRAIRKGNAYWYASGDLSGFIRSSNSGATWEWANEGLMNYRVEDIAVNTANRDQLIIATPGGVYRSTDAGGNWTRSTGNIPAPNYYQNIKHAISAVHWSKANANICYAGTYNLTHPYAAAYDDSTYMLYKSTNGGVSFDSLSLNGITWAQRKDDVIFCIETNPTNVNEVYLATQRYLWKSTNGGTSWNKVTSHYRDITYNSKTYKKEGSWHVVIDSLNPTHVYSAFYGYEAGSYNGTGMASLIDYNGTNLLRSTDSGISWTEIKHSNMNNRTWVTEEIQFTDNWQALYVGSRHGEFNSFYKYNPLTEAFTLLGIPTGIDIGWDELSPCVFTSFAISGDTIINVPHSWKSTDAGLTWKQNYTVSAGDGFYTTTGMEIQVIREVIVNPTTGDIYTGNDDAPYKYSTNNGESWKVNNAVKVNRRGISQKKILVSTKDIAFKDANTFWVSQFNWKKNSDTYLPGIPDYDGTILKTTNGGITFDYCTNGIMSADTFHIKNLYYKGGDTLFAMKHNDGTWRSTDGGDNWYKMSNGVSGTDNSNRIPIIAAPSNRNIMYAGAQVPQSSKYGIWKSTDGGTTWFNPYGKSTNTADNDLNCITDIIVDSTNANIVWITQGHNSNAAKKGNGGVWKSTDGGATWNRKFTLAARDGYVISNPHFNNVAFYRGTDTLVCAIQAGGDPSIGLWYGHGVWMSTDGGDNWTEFNTGLSYEATYALATYGQNIYLGMQGNGIAIYTKE